MAKFRVIRKFSSSVPHAVNDIVDFEGGHTEKLISQRYIVPYDASAPEASQKVAAAVVATPAAETQPEATEPPAKKKRGRPKKVVTDAVVD